MSNEIEFYQNGHITLVNPDHLGSPAAQFLGAVLSSDLSPPGDYSFDGERTDRAGWALSRRSGLITAPSRDADGWVYFANNTADRAADLGSHRWAEANSHPAKEFFFMAAASQPSGGVLAGWILEGFNLSLPPSAGDRPPRSKHTEANLLRPAAGAPLLFRKFHYSSTDGEFLEVAEAISVACQIYLAAGWGEAEVVEKLALPAMEAASQAGLPYGYAVVVGTVLVPAAALAGADSEGRLPRPLAINLRYDAEEELHCKLCCFVRRVDARALRSLPGGAAYPLVVSAVVEGANDRDLGHEGVVSASAAEGFLEDFRELVREVDARGGAGPGEDEEVAQEIARSVLEEDCGPKSGGGVYPMVWTQFSTGGFVRAVQRQGDGRLGRIASRVREVILLAAAIRAVRPKVPAYEGYLQWSKEGVSP